MLPDGHSRLTSTRSASGSDAAGDEKGAVSTWYAGDNYWTCGLVHDSFHPSGLLSRPVMIHEPPAPPA
nr:hypothetical protein CFP56_64830 [Quercus suber]